MPEIQLEVVNPLHFLDLKEVKEWLLKQKYDDELGKQQLFMKI